jgi:hypothetical protein
MLVAISTPLSNLDFNESANTLRFDAGCVPQVGIATPWRNFFWQTDDFSPLNSIHHLIIIRVDFVYAQNSGFSLICPPNILIFPRWYCLPGQAITLWSVECRIVTVS